MLGVRAWSAKGSRAEALGLGLGSFFPKPYLNPKSMKSCFFMAMIRGLGLLFYILLGCR